MDTKFRPYFPSPVARCYFFRCILVIGFVKGI